MFAKVSMVRSERDGRGLVFGVRRGSSSFLPSPAGSDVDPMSSTGEPLVSWGRLEALGWRLAIQSSAELSKESMETSVARLGVLLVKRLVRRCGVETTRLPLGRCAGGRLTLDRSWSREAAGRRGVEWPREAVDRSFGLCSSRPPEASAEEGGRGADETLDENVGLGIPDLGSGSRESLGVPDPAGRSCEASIVVKGSPLQGEYARDKRCRCTSRFLSQTWGWRLPRTVVCRRGGSSVAPRCGNVAHECKQRQ
jgi:hypothetical protein